MNTRIFTKKRREHNGNDTGIQIFVVSKKEKRYHKPVQVLYSMKIVSYTSARKNLKSLFDNACDDSSVIFVQRRNGKGVVILSEEEYSSLDETAYLLSNPKNRKHLQQSLSEKEKNETISVSLDEL